MDNEKYQGAGLAPIRLLLIGDIHAASNSAGIISRARLENEVNRAMDFVRAPRSLRYRNEYRTVREIHRDLGELLEKFSPRVDHVLIAGDIADDYSEKSLHSLDRVLSNYGPRFISAVPGNHDIFNLLNLSGRRRQETHFTKHLGKFICIETTEHGADPRRFFPYLKQVREDCFVIGLDTTHSATSLLMRGRLGRMQLGFLDRTLNSPLALNAHKIILMHHNPTIGNPLNYDYLINSKKFLDVLKNHAGHSEWRDVTVVFGHSHSKAILTNLVENVNFICVPMFALKEPPDYVAIEIAADGSVSELSP